MSKVKFSYEKYSMRKTVSTLPSHICHCQWMDVGCTKIYPFHYVPHRDIEDGFFVLEHFVNEEVFHSKDTHTFSNTQFSEKFESIYENIQKLGFEIPTISQWLRAFEVYEFDSPTGYWLQDDIGLSSVKNIVSCCGKRFVGVRTEDHLKLKNGFKHLIRDYKLHNHMIDYSIIKELDTITEKDKKRLRRIR